MHSRIPFSENALSQNRLLLDSAEHAAFPQVLGSAWLPREPLSPAQT
jgi:hypothetical protein